MRPTGEGRLDASVAGYAEAIGPEPDEVQREMEDRARDQGFPIAGRAAGGWLTQVAAMVGASRVLELGSGFGYSASWFARGMQGGDIVLTERDPDLLEDARSYLERGGYEPSFGFEAGDALESLARYDGPFDVVFLDLDKPSYPEAFDAVRDMVVDGGAVVADNVMWAGNDEEGDVVNFPALAEVHGDPDAVLDDVEMPEGAEPGTRGALEYLQKVAASDEYRTTLLPVDDGLSVSVNHPL